MGEPLKSQIVSFDFVINRSYDTVYYNQIGQTIKLQNHRPIVLLSVSCFGLHKLMDVCGKHGGIPVTSCVNSPKANS